MRFLLVRHSNIGPILHRFKDIASYCAHDPPIFSLIFVVFPLDQIADVAVSREFISEVF